MSQRDVREMADRYYELTGESALSGVTGTTYLFVDGPVRGDDAGREHMRHLLSEAERRTPAWHRWTSPDEAGHVHLVDSGGNRVRTIDATEHPWRG